jgi:uncharacterized damage-inducible protein DinB
MAASREMLIHLVDYTNWANARVRAMCATVPTAELERDLGASHGSLLRTLTHMYYAERVWLERMLEDRLPEKTLLGAPRLFNDTPERPTFAELQQIWPPLGERIRGYVEAATDLDGSVLGPDCSIPRWRLLMHVVNHATLHRGQVITMLRQVGVNPVNLDLFEHHMFPDSPSTN